MIASLGNILSDLDWHKLLVDKGNKCALPTGGSNGNSFRGDTGFLDGTL